MSYYEILEVNNTASFEVITASYKALAKKYHPDVYYGDDAEKRMKKLNEAYAVLSNYEKRQKYDAFLKYGCNNESFDYQQSYSSTEGRGQEQSEQQKYNSSNSAKDASQNNPPSGDKFDSGENSKNSKEPRTLLLLYCCFILCFIIVISGLFMHDKYYLRIINNTLDLLNDAPTIYYSDEIDVPDVNELFKKIIILVDEKNEIIRNLYNNCTHDYYCKESLSSNEISILSDKLIILKNENYLRSSDYLTLLIAYQLNQSYYVSYPSDEYNQLYQLINFIDAKSLIVGTQEFFEQFMLGNWTTEDNNYYFTLEQKDGTFNCSYNLPYTYSDGYFFVSSGVYSIGKDADSASNTFSFTVVDENTVTVFCYSNSSAYTLYRR